MQDIFKNIKFKDESIKNKILHMIDKLPQGDDDISIDMADVTTVLDKKGIIDIKEIHSMNVEDLSQKIGWLCDDLKYREVQSVLALCEISKDTHLNKLVVVMDKISEFTNEDAVLIFGTSEQNDFEESEIKATILLNIDVESEEKEKAFQAQDYIVAHIYTANNKSYIEKSKECGCCYCKRRFSSGKIVDYISENTAVCPYCSVDAVICDEVVDISDELLDKMCKHWF